MKRCKKCLNDLPLSFFHKNARIKCGRSTHCKACKSKARRKNPSTPLPTPEVEVLNDIRFDQVQMFIALKDCDLNNRMKVQLGVLLETFQVVGMLSEEQDEALRNIFKLFS